MGIYEYACTQCNHVTDLFVPLSERPAMTECHKCGAPAEFTISAVKTTFHANDRKAIKRSGH